MKGQFGFGLIDKISQAIRALRERALRAVRRVAPPKRRIYFWRITYSGIVRCPYQRHNAKESTQVIWELTFEEPPYFRSYSSDMREAFERYDREIKILIKEQELRMITWRSKTGKIGALTWSRWIPKEELPESWRKEIEKMMKAGRLSKTEMEMLSKGYVKVPERPILEIRDYSYERVSVLIDKKRREYIEVDRPFKKATDRFRFTVYRPPYTTDDEICSWEDDFEHDL